MQNAVAIAFLVAGSILDVYFVRRAVECFDRGDRFPGVMWLVNAFAYIAIPLSLIYR